MKLWEEMNQRIKKFGIIDEKLAQLVPFPVIEFRDFS